jgi:histidine decarboxylase
LKDFVGNVQTQTGYPTNQDFDYSELFPFLNYSINNVGDPFDKSNYRINTMEFEREVIHFFTELTQLPKEEVWGYVTNGGTEGNIYGVFLGREMLPDAMVYYSEDTHYSVGKAMRLLGVRSMMIRCQENGEFDYDDLRESIKLRRDMPAIVFTTIGTTMTGAIDNIKTIKGILEELLIDRHYIHSDAALSGMILPFVDDPPEWDFKDGIDSISISGHKMIGSPIPCGVVLAKHKNVKRIARKVEYVGALDTTITGSRNAITPLFLWYAIKRYGLEGFRDLVRGCHEVADYAIEEMEKIGVKAWRNKHGNTVVFPKPSGEVLDRWQIAIHGKIAHIITMPHITRDKIDRLVADMKAYPLKEES